MRVFDVHVHYGWFDRIGSRDSATGWLDELTRVAAESNIVKIGLLGWPELGNDLVADAIQEKPDLIRGMAMLNMDEDSPKVVKQFYDRGFSGLKLIHPARNYDDPKYFGIYERAEALNMPILFHTGIIGGPVDYLMGGGEDAWKAIPQGEEEQKLVERLRDKARLSPYGRGSARMQPIYLDTIATYFPKLYMIGAHLGWPDYITACAIARWRPRLFFDISGGDVVRRHIETGGYIKQEIRPEKLVYASDCDLTRVKKDVGDWKKYFDKISLTPEEQDLIFYKNAARMFGVEGD
ncbi:MAG: amidohydrolase family protein [Limnochordia bacterium]|nr:amidohydrolase family protein [Limnochordia bacterium]